MEFDKHKILEMFEKDAKKSGKRADEILVGDRLYEKIFGVDRGRVSSFREEERLENREDLEGRV